MGSRIYDDIVKEQWISFLNNYYGPDNLHILTLKFLQVYEGVTIAIPILQKRKVRQNLQSCSYQKIVLVFKCMSLSKF